MSQRVARWAAFPARKTGSRPERDTALGESPYLGEAWSDMASSDHLRSPNTLEKSASNPIALAKLALSRWRSLQFQRTGLRASN